MVSAGTPCFGRSMTIQRSEQSSSLKVVKSEKIIFSFAFISIRFQYLAQKRFWNAYKCQVFPLQLFHSNLYSLSHINIEVIRHPTWNEIKLVIFDVFKVLLQPEHSSLPAFPVLRLQWQREQLRVDGSVRQLLPKCRRFRPVHFSLGRLFLRQSHFRKFWWLIPELSKLLKFRSTSFSMWTISLLSSLITYFGDHTPTFEADLITFISW